MTPPSYIKRIQLIRNLVFYQVFRYNGTTVYTYMKLLAIYRTFSISTVKKEGENKKRVFLFVFALSFFPGPLLSLDLLAFSSQSSSHLSFSRSVGQVCPEDFATSAIASFLNPCDLPLILLLAESETFHKDFYLVFIWNHQTKIFESSFSPFSDDLSLKWNHFCNEIGKHSGYILQISPEQCWWHMFSRPSFRTTFHRMSPYFHLYSLIS